jgi:hypothetical protein
MNKLKFIWILLLGLQLTLTAQVTDVVQGVIRVKKPIGPTSMTANGPACGGVLGKDSINRKDSVAKEKPLKPIVPYVKIEYSLFLCNVKKAQTIRYVEGIPYRDEIPVFDSLVYGHQLKRVFPKKTTTMGKYFSNGIDYKYAGKDSNAVDTMHVGLWIDKNGTIKWAEADTVFTGGMPEQMEDELYAKVQVLLSQKWGNGGGYKTTKRFLKPSQFVGESYYCEMFIIVSGKPLTKEQQTNGSHYAPFDFPLNSPPIDEKQRDSMEENVSPRRKQK